MSSLSQSTADSAQESGHCLRMALCVLSAEAASAPAGESTSHPTMENTSSLCPAGLSHQAPVAGQIVSDVLRQGSGDACKTHVAPAQSHHSMETVVEQQSQHRCRILRRLQKAPEPVHRSALPRGRAPGASLRGSAQSTTSCSCGTTACTGCGTALASVRCPRLDRRGGRPPPQSSACRATGARVWAYAMHCHWVGAWTCVKQFMCEVQCLESIRQPPLRQRL